MALHPRGRRSARRCRAHPQPSDARIRRPASAILNGTLILIDRLSGSQSGRYFSGKHKREHGSRTGDPARIRTSFGRNRFSSLTGNLVFRRFS
jgi:hypothetical protein